MKRFVRIANLLPTVMFLLILGLTSLSWGEGEPLPGFSNYSTQSSQTPVVLAEGWIGGSSITSLGEVVWSQYDQATGWNQFFSSTRGQLTFETGARFSPVINNLGDKIWVDYSNDYPSGYILRGSINGKPVTLANSQNGIGGVDMNDRGEVVWAQADAWNFSQIYSNLRGQLTSGYLHHNNPSINNAGDVVFVQSDPMQPELGQVYKIAAGSTTAAAVTTDNLNYRSAAVNDGGEIVWTARDMSNPTAGWQVASSVRGVLPVQVTTDIFSLDVNNCGDIVYNVDEYGQQKLYRLGDNAQCVSYPVANDTQTEATAVGFGGIFTGAMDGSTNPVDWYRFDAIAGDKIYVTTSYDSRPTNTFSVGLYDGQGNLVKGSDSLPPRIVATAGYSGSYYLKFEGQGGRYGYAVSLSKYSENCGTGTCRELVTTDPWGAAINSLGEVVWGKYDQSTGGSQLFSSTRGQLTFETGSRFNPVVNNLGDIVWEENSYNSYGEPSGYILRGTINGKPATLANSQNWFGGADINDRGEVVWAQGDTSNFNQIYSNLRGQLTSGNLNHSRPSINNAGDVVFVQSDPVQPDLGQVYKIAAGSTTAAAVTTDNLNYRSAAVNDGGEIVWTARDMSNPASGWQVASNVRGLLPVPLTKDIFGVDVNNCGDILYSSYEDNQASLYRFGSNAPCVSYPVANDTQTDATAVAFGGIFTGLMDGSANPVDWYRFDAIAGDKIYVTVNYDNRPPNTLTMGLYDAQGNFISGPTGVNPLRITATAGYSGSYYLKFEGQGGRYGYAVSLSKYSENCGTGTCRELLATETWSGSINSLGEVVWSKYDEVSGRNQFFSSTRGQITFDLEGSSYNPAINNLGDMIWVEYSYGYPSGYILRGTINGNPVTLSNSQNWIGEVDINDVGEVVWSQTDSSNLNRIYSNLRGQLTSGNLYHNRPSINNAGDVVFVQSDPMQPEQGQVYKLAAGSVTPVAVTPENLACSGAAVNDIGEIVWTTRDMSNPASRWQVVSNLRGLLPVQLTTDIAGIDVNNCGDIIYSIKEEAEQHNLYRFGSNGPCMMVPQRAFSLAATKSGSTGNGEMVSSPAGILVTSADALGMAVFPAGTVVTLTATPDADSIFFGWTGGCSGTGICQVTMDQAKGVTAIFQPKGLETTPPTVTITSPVAGFTSNRTPQLLYAASSGTVAVTVDGIVVSLVSGDLLGPLAAGMHTVRVEATNSLGTGFAEVTFTVGTEQVSFSDDMENGPFKWESATGLWHVVSSSSPYPNSHQGTNSWWYGQDTTGNYDVGQNAGWIISSPFTVPQSGKLTFWSWEQTESGGTYDTRKVYLSTDGGYSWVELFQSLDNSSAWHEVNVDLAMYAGMEAKLKFEFSSVDAVANAYRGWYVDDIALVGAATPPPSTNTKEGFETGNFSAFPWVMSGNQPWLVTTSPKYDGLYAARAGLISDNQSSTMETTVDCAAGMMTFWFSIDSEANWDFLHFYVDGVEKGQWSGYWPWTQMSVPVTAGTHTFRWVYSKDSSVSVGSDTAWVDDIAFSGSTLAPTVSISSPAPAVTYKNAPLLNYSVSDGTVVVRADGVVVDKVSGATLDMLGDGAHIVRVEATNSAGTGFAEVVFTVDTTPPALSINQAVSPTNINSQTISGMRESGALITLSANTSATVGAVSYPSATTWSCMVSDLAEGDNVILVMASDAATNVAMASVTITLDTQAPAVFINSPAGGITNDANPLLLYTVSDGNVVVKVDGVVVNKASGSRLDTLAEGAHSVKVEASDAAGNVGSDETICVVDITPPAVAIDPVIAITSSNSQTITGRREVNAAVSVSVNTAATVGALSYPSATTWSCTISGLMEGGNVITATVTDAALNSATASNTITLDTIAPVVAITSPTVGITNSRTPALTYSVSEGAAVVKLDGVVVTKASGDTLGPLADGPHTVMVETTDAAGNPAFAEVTFTVDATAPTVIITSPTTGLGNNTTPVLLYSVSDGTAVVKVNGVVLPLLSGATLEALADGTHTVRVESTDAAGNAAFAEVSFTVDATAPSVTISSPAAGLTKNNAPVLTFAAGDGTVVVKVDGVIVSKVSGDTLAALADGLHVMRVESTDAASNTGFAEVSFTVDTAAPVVGITTPAAGLTNNSNPALAYTVSDGTAVVKVDGVAVPKVSGDALDTLADGTHTVRVEATDAAGNVSFAEVTFTVDTVQPSVGINSVITPANNNSQTITGTREIDAAIGVAVNTGASVGGVEYPTTTTWSCTLTSLAEGVNGITVTASDAAGNGATASTGITLDTVAPTATISAPTSELTNSRTPVLTYAVSEGTPVIKVDGVVITKASGDTLGPLADGQHTVRVETADAAGNPAFAEVTFTVDATVPTVTITSPTTGFGNNRTPVLLYSVSDGTAVVKVDGVVLPLLSGDALGTLADGIHTVRVESTDAAGNAAFAEVSFTVDATAPSVTITSPTAGLTGNNAPVLAFAAGDGAVVVKVDGVVVNKLSGDNLATLADGLHVVRIESTDAAFNTGFAEVSFTVDTAAPVVGITSPAAGLTNNSRPALAYTVSDGTAVVKVDGVAVSKLSGDALDTLADGTHTVRVEAVDAAGNASFAEVTSTVDTVQPSLGINPVVSPANNNSQTIAGTREIDAAISVAVNTAASVGAVEYPTSTTWSCTITNLAEGVNGITVTVSDAAGNSATASTGITLDTVAPMVTITAPTSELTNSRTPVLTFTVSEGTPVVKVDGVIITKASGDTLGPLADGQHTVRVETTDAAGNPAFAEVSFTVDATAPMVTITSPTTGVGNNRTPVLLYSVSDGTAVVKVDGVVLPLLFGDALGTFADGIHIVRVESSDAAGNAAFAEVSFTVDATAPGVTITSPAAGLTGNNAPVLEFAAGDGSVVVKVDGVVVSKLSGDTLAALADGLHVMRIESTDAAANTGFAEVSFTVDTTAPVVGISSPAAGLTNHRNPLLAYTLSDGTAIVKVDGVTVSKASGDLLDALADGPHTVRIEATDAAGNASFAEVTFTVDATAPVVSITSPAAGTTPDHTPLLAYTAGDGSVVVKVDGVVVSKASGSSLDVLGNGTHTVTVESTDLAGNVGISSVTFMVSYTPLAVATASLSWGTTGVTYSQTLTTSGGVPTYTWSVASGSLPDGLSFSPSTGAITGVPTATGSFTFTVQAADSDGASATRSLTVAVYAPVQVASTSLAAGYAGASYGQSLAATGGLAPYLWSISSGSLPAGLTLNAETGEISGTPTVAGSTFTVQAMDVNQSVATKSLSITINSPRPDLVVAAVSGPASGVRGKKVALTATVTNQGQATAAGSTVSLYLSADSTTITTGDIKLADITINSLTMGSSQTVSVNATIPSGTVVGTYYLVAIADRGSVVAETNETNNTRSGSTIEVK